MDFLHIDPLVLVALVTLAAVVRLVSLLIVLRGTTPSERAAIIRALAEFFRMGPRKRR